MADSTPAGQDDAQARLNGLMGSLGKRTQERDAAVARVAELEAQLQAQEPAATPVHSQPEQEPGEVVWQSPDGRSTRVRLPDGSIAQYETGVPLSTNPARERKASAQDDGSPGWARRQLANALGTALPKTNWP
jgi:hypothetical protein